MGPRIYGPETEGFEATDLNPVPENEGASRTGNAFVDGYTVHGRRPRTSLPGEIVSMDEADAEERWMDGIDWI